MWLLLSTALWADEGLDGPLIGKPVSEVIDAYRESDEPFAYSTSLVEADMLVVVEPGPGTPFEIVTRILKPHRLMVKMEAGVYLVIRMPDSASDEPIAAQPADVPAGPPQELMEMVVVSASRYAIARDIGSSKFTIDQRTIQNMPDLGEDPIRITQRLPGAAASGGSAVAHFRGGEKGEIGIMLNGQWLFDPFHIRDYQNIFSAIDARAIEGVEVYTGGFPVRYGDRMSGMVLMDSLQSEKPRYNEIGISVFNTSFLTTGHSDSMSWLLSARRGNLDLVIDPQFGSPSYFDVFGELAYQFGEAAKLSVNALFAEDTVQLILESEPTERDQVSSDTRNAQLWLRLDSQWSDSLSSTTVLSFIDFKNRRIGLASDVEKMVASVDDYREVQQTGLRQDWFWAPSEQHRAQWGIHATSSDARFDYRGMAEYFGLLALYEGQPQVVTRSVFAQPNGGSYAIYLSDQWRLSDRTILEWGLRWDDQTYTELSADSQLSPRLSILHRPRENLELRLSIGRYFQSQAIQTLQVEDDVVNYWPAQRADHIILGLRYLTRHDSTVRIETFHKDIGRVRPRFENLFDPLGLMPELQPDRVRLAPSKARAQGVEISADRTLGDLTWWGSYTWSRVTDRIGDKDVVRSWDQTHSIQGGVDWRGERWSFSTAVSAHTGWPTTGLELNDDDVAIPGQRNSVRHDVFSSVDVRLSRKFDVRRGSLLAFIEISNVLDRNNDCCIDWDITEDQAGNDVLERGQDFWMPLLPAVGVLWEF